MLFVARRTALPTPGEGERWAKASDAQASVAKTNKRRFFIAVLRSKVRGSGSGTAQQRISKPAAMHVFRDAGLPVHNQRPHVPSRRSEETRHRAASLGRERSPHRP